MRNQATTRAVRTSQIRTPNLKKTETGEGKNKLPTRDPRGIVADSTHRAGVPRSSPGSTWCLSSTPVIVFYMDRHYKKNIQTHPLTHTDGQEKNFLKIDKYRHISS